MEIINNSLEDIYIPYMFHPYTVYQDGMDVTRVFNENWDYYPPDYDMPRILPYQYEDTLNVMRPQDYKFHRIIEVLEKKIFLDLNPDKDSLEYYLLDDCEEQFVTFKYYVDYKYAGGISLKAGEKRDYYYPINILYDKYTDKPLHDYEFRFRRESHFTYALYDTIKLEGHFFYTPLLEEAGGFKLYHGDITCDDVVRIYKGQ